MAMQTNADVTQSQDEQARKRSGWLAACLTFGAAYAIFIFSFGYWGLALGWLLSTMIAATFGWIAYCFPWWIEAVGLLVELLAALG